MEQDRMLKSLLLPLGESSRGVGAIIHKKAVTMSFPLA